LVRHSGDFFGEGEMKKTFPVVPQLAERILRLLYAHDYYLERSGDLEEAYAELGEEFGSFRAKVWLWFQILKLFYGIIRINVVCRFIMLKNYIKIAFRISVILKDTGGIRSSILPDLPLVLLVLF
jgi:hypothetical protein